MLICSQPQRSFADRQARKYWLYRFIRPGDAPPTFLKSDARHIVSPEKSVGVIAKPGDERIHLAVVNLIHAQLIYML